MRNNYCLEKKIIIAEAEKQSFYKLSTDCKRIKFVIKLT